MIITSKSFVSVIRLNFVDAVNGKGKAKDVSASPLSSITFLHNLLTNVSKDLINATMSQ